MNPYDSCVMNKMVNGKQITVGWHVNNLKISHVDQEAFEDLVTKLENRFGKEAPLVVNRGSVHDYLGMRINFSEPGKVIFSMKEYIEKLINEALEDLMKGASTSPAAHHLFNVDKNCEKLDPSLAILFHHLVA